MSILNDREIKAYCENPKNGAPLITPFVGHQVNSKTKLVSSDNGSITTSKRKVLSYGLDSFGYDVRLDEEIKIYVNTYSEIIDPKDFKDSCFQTMKVLNDLTKGKYVILPPSSYALGKTIESFNIPEDITVLCTGKSTYARAGIIVNPTSFKSGFSGIIVIEVANTSGLPVRLYINEGIATCLFFKGEKPLKTYEGQYQNQNSIQLPSK